jgi:hypothetical protein
VAMTDPEDERDDTDDEPEMVLMFRGKREVIRLPFSEWQAFTEAVEANGHTVDEALLDAIRQGIANTVAGGGPDGGQRRAHLDRERRNREGPPRIPAPRTSAEPPI